MNGARAVVAAAAALRSGASPALTIESMNQQLRRMEYAVRGPLVKRADALRTELKSGGADLPFSEVTALNIGNPQALEQKPLSFPRQVLACAMCPDIMKHADTLGFPSDVVERASTLLESAGGSIGSYSHSQGLPAVRESVVNFLKERDGDLGNFSTETVYCTDGASVGAKTILDIVINDGRTEGIMIPIPQYPLYTAALASMNAHPVPYYLDESNGWSMTVGELRRSVALARSNGVEPRALVVINPGNPTGQCLSADNIADVLNFARENNMLVVADEVYQTNVYAQGKEFTSFRKVLSTLEDPHEVLLASLHSTSKGFFGECGLRGGFMEVAHMDEHVQAELYKAVSVSLCSNVPGQVALETMVNPPKEGDPSYNLYVTERDGIFASLKRRAAAVRDGLNAMEGVHCNDVEGALYAFPSIQLPKRFCAEAKKQGVAADALYSFLLLEATGVCVVPGSGFGQHEGTHHFRCTILPPEDKLPMVLEAMQKFHKEFLDEYAGDKRVSKGSPFG